MKAPFPYFGGKSTVAHHVWSAFGDVKHYIDPFCGSCAVLLARPKYDPLRHMETVNDANGWIANAWRAIAWAPDDVLKLADWPVNHCDKIARTRALNAAKSDLTAKLMADPKFFDAELAAYYIYCQCTGIATWWSSAKQRPNVAHGGNGLLSLASRSGDTRRQWMHTLAERMRHVRVVCGDWSQVCGGNWHDHRGIAGIFFDPPYAVEDRCAECYGEEDSLTVANDVRAFCLKHGNKPTYRIVLAGYDEHDELAAHGWTMQRWKAKGGMGNQANNGNANRHRECLWYSPACLHGGLFDAEETTDETTEADTARKPGSDEGLSAARRQPGPEGAD